MTTTTGQTLRFRALRSIAALMLREMTTRYGRSVGGYIWAIAEPIGAILLLSVGFSLVLRTPSLGTSFLLFYATGYLPFNLYATLSGRVAKSIRNVRGLLAYPEVSFIDAILARFILNTLTQCLVFYLLVAGILMVIDTRAVLDIAPILSSLAVTALLGFGVGVTNCYLFAVFPVWEQVWTIATRPLFLASGIFYLHEDLPRIAQDILWFNPIAHLVGIMRRGFYPTYDAAWASTLYPLAVALALTAVGLLLLRRHHRTVLNA